MRALGLGFVLALASCSASKSPSKGPPPAGALAASSVPAVPALREPDTHRPQALSCPHQRGPGAAKESQGSCKVDADCKKGNGGRCVSYYGGGQVPPSNECDYDGCFADSDCGNGALCLCGHDDKQVGEGHRCVAANCRSDGECGAGRFCSPSAALCSRRSQPGHYYCHTRSDECVNDSDCPQSTQKGYGPMATGCVYSPEVGHWACASAECPVG